MPDRRRVVAGIVIAAGAAATVLLALLTTSGSGSAGTGPPGSSFATAAEGAKAAYLVLEKLGHGVTRSTRPLGDFGPSRLAFVLAPPAAPDDSDADALADWVKGGGTLVFGLTPFVEDRADLYETLGVPHLEVRLRPPYVATLDAEWAPARRIEARVALAVRDGEDDAAVTFARAGERGAGLRFDRGKGRIYVVDARMLSNEGLRAHDNAVFLAALAARHAGGNPIVFDESVHGFGDAVSLLGVTGWPLRAGLWLGALALVTYALAAGRRLGRASPEPRPPRRASVEQIEILAAYLGAHHDRGTALAALAAATGRTLPDPEAAAKNDAAFVRAARHLLAGGSAKSLAPTPPQPP